MTKRYLKLISLCIISFALTACTNSAAGQSSRENDLALQGITQSKILKNVENTKKLDCLSNFFWIYFNSL